MPLVPHRGWWTTRRAWLAAFVLALVGWLGAGALGAHLLTRGRPATMPTWTTFAERPLENVATRTDDGVTVRGWLARAADEHGCVVLAPGIRGNRLAMLERARWYLARGWSTLLVDLRGNGESDAARVAMGWNEALDLAAWAAFARGRGFAKVAVHGQSLGAAAAVYSASRAPATAWHFVVLEACYRDVHAALAARLPWLPAASTWPLLAACEWLLGVDAAQLAPVAAIAALRAPTLLACGDADVKVGPDATAALLAACGAACKERCDVPGAGHVDLWAAGDTFRAHLAAFVAAR